MNKKRFIAAIAALTMLISAFGGLSAGAFDEWSYDEDVSVYVNGNKIDNKEYKPIIANDRTLVRLVPIFDALGYGTSDGSAEAGYYSFTAEDKSISIVKKGTNATYTFIAESQFAIIGTGGGSPYNLEVPATLQYFDTFYVPIRAFCEMVGLNIEWNDTARSVYITDNSEFGKAEETPNAGVIGNQTADISVPKQENLLGYEYCFKGMVVGKAVPKMYNEGDMTMEEIKKHSEEYYTSYKTNSGLTPQKALDIINAAYGEKATGTVHIYPTYAQAYTNESTSGYNYFRVEYKPNGSDWAQKKNVPCYEVYACPDENFSDTNTTGKVIDINGNDIGGAN